MIYIKLKSVKKHCICLQTNLWSRFLQSYYFDYNRISVQDFYSSYQFFTINNMHIIKWYIGYNNTQ